MNLNTTLKTTPLHARHRALGARMMDFGGWDMPLSYGSQIEEHLAVRQDAGLFDVSHMLPVDIAGPGAEDFLRHLLANDVARLRTPGQALYSCMLNAHGGVIDDLIVYRRSASQYRLIVNAGTADKDLAWLEQQRQARHSDLAIQARRDLALLAIQGPRARDRVWQALPEIRPATDALAPFQAAETGPWFVARTGYTGEDGFEILLPAGLAETTWQALTAAGIRPAGLGARDTLRLEAGMNLYGQDMDEDTSPLDAGLGWTVRLDDGRDFIGQSALRAQGQRHRLLGLVLTQRGMLRAGQSVATEHGPGHITSGSFAPTLQQSIALARLPLASRPGDTVAVDIRGRPAPARVVQPPFVRHGKILV